MISQQTIDFYGTVRRNPALWAELAEAPDQEAMIARAASMAKAQNVDVSIEDVRAALDQLGALISSAATTEDSLTDDELELVSAGINNCGNKRRLSEV